MFTLQSLKVLTLVLLTLFFVSFLPLSSAYPAELKPLQIHQISFQDELDSSVELVASRRFVICDGCAQITQLTQVVAPPAPAPLTINFSKNPLQPKEERKKEAPELTEPLLVVHFALASSELKGGEKKKLSSSLRVLKQNIPLTITGFTCELGSQDVNDRLALKRGQRVGAFLRTHGFSAEDVEVQGKGRCCYTDPGNHSVNRRVEIYKKHID